MKKINAVRWILGILCVGWAISFVTKGDIIPAILAMVVITQVLPPIDKNISSQIKSDKTRALYNNKVFKVVTTITLLISMIGLAANNTSTVTDSSTSTVAISPSPVGFQENADNRASGVVWSFDQVTNLMTLSGISYKTKVNKVDNMDKYIGFFNNNNGNIQLFGTKDNITKVDLRLNKEAVDDLITGVPVLVSGLVGDQGASQKWTADQLQAFMTKRGEYDGDTDSYFSEAKTLFDGIQVWLTFEESKSTTYKSLGAFIERK